MASPRLRELLQRVQEKKREGAQGVPQGARQLQRDNTPAPAPQRVEQTTRPVVQGPPRQLSRPSLARPSQPQPSPPRPTAPEPTSPYSSPPIDTGPSPFTSSQSDADTHRSNVRTPVVTIVAPKTPRAASTSDQAREPYRDGLFGPTIYDWAFESRPPSMSDRLREPYQPQDAYRGNQWRPAYEDKSGPPFPPHMPQITPVAQTKNRTAQASQYSPRAASVLFQTPTKIQYMPGGGGFFDPSQNEGWELFVGGMTPGVAAGQPGSAEDVIEHEFGHKWQATQLPRSKVEEWTRAAPALANMADYPRDPGGNWLPNQYEMYAGFAQSGPFGRITGPFGMSDSMRERFYPGLYREDLSVPPMPSSWDEYAALGNDPVAKKQYLLDNPDFLDEYVKRYGIGSRESENEPPQTQPLYAERRGDPFSTEYWAKEYEAPLGYYEDGSAVRTQRPYPGRWSPPQFPSIKEYTRFMGGMG